MSSSIRYNPDAFANLSKALAGQLGGDDEPRALSPRQKRLNQLWAWYRCSQYETRRTAWDGTPALSRIDRDSVASGTFLPPGFYDAAGQLNDIPLKFRQPTAPYQLPRMIVNRFTGLLFTQRHHPQVEVPGDEVTEDFVDGIAEASRLWAAMMLARTYGGAMGTVAIGFRFTNGRPRIDVFDPRWATPTFKNRADLELSELELRYQYPIERLDQDGKWVRQWFWYRRVIGENRDVVYAPAPVERDREPTWAEEDVVEHGLGECPAVWIQNLPVGDDIDGEADTHGIFECVEEFDALKSQAFRGTLANCDPSLVITTDAKLDDLQGGLQKGSGHALKLPAGSDAKYLEIAATGIAAARELAAERRKEALEIAQCVLEHPDTANRTATEIERVYSSMLDKADILREQYGEHGIKVLVEKMLRATVKVTTKTAVRPGGVVERGAIHLPPKVQDGTLAERKIGDRNREFVQLRWPPYFLPSLIDAQTAAGAVAVAKSARVMDQEQAVKFVAPFFGIEDAQKTIATIRQEDADQDKQFASSLLTQNAVPGPGPEGR